MATKRQTAKALAGSIEKWRAIVEKRGEDNGDSNCPLCKLFFNSGCHGCSVMKTTGRGYCDGSPFRRWVSHQERIHDAGPPYSNLCGTCTRLARAELKFLEGLTP